MAKYNTKSPTAEQVRWGFENLNLTETASRAASA